MTTPNLTSEVRSKLRDADNLRLQTLLTFRASQRAAYPDEPQTHQFTLLGRAIFHLPRYRRMAQLRANTLARVLYAFEAEDPNSELSVTTQDVVLVLENGVEDGWRKVQRQRDGRSGFVPNDYLAPLPSHSESTSSAAASSLPSGEPEGAPRSPVQQERLAATSSASSSSSLALQPLPSSSLSSAAVSAAASSIPFSALPKEYSDLLSNHEQWFREATTKRSEVYRNLQGQATDLGRAIAESESRSKALLSRISELEGLINDERSKWNAPPAAPATTASSASTVPALMASGYGGR